MILLQTPPASSGGPGWVTVIIGVLGFLTTTWGAAYGLYRIIKTTKENARKAKDADEAAIRTRIAEAVATEKASNKQGIENAEKLAKHWEGMAEVLTKEKEHDREVYLREKEQKEAELIRVRTERNVAVAELDAAKMKIEQVVDFNLGLQGTQVEMSKQLKALQQEVENLRAELKRFTDASTKS